MSTPAYHHWTHRSKELGGTDPLDILDPPYHIKVFSDTQVVTTGDGKFMWHIPRMYHHYYLVEIEIFVTTVSSSGKPTVQLRNVTQSHDMLTTRVEIDAGEEASADAATQVVINQSNNRVNWKDKLAIDVDVAGSGAKGLEVVPLFEKWQIP